MVIGVIHKKTEEERSDFLERANLIKRAEAAEAALRSVLNVSQEYSFGFVADEVGAADGDCVVEFLEEQGVLLSAEIEGKRVVFPTRSFDDEGYFRLRETHNKGKTVLRTTITESGRRFIKSIWRAEHGKAERD